MGQLLKLLHEARAIVTAIIYCSLTVCVVEFLIVSQTLSGLMPVMHIDPQPVGQHNSSSLQTSLLLQPKSIEQKT